MHVPTLTDRKETVMMLWLHVVNFVAVRCLGLQKKDYNYTIL